MNGVVLCKIVKAVGQQEAIRESDGAILGCTIH